MSDLRVRLAGKLGITNRWVLVKRGLYYRPNAKGYTSRIEDAWILTKEEADKHVYPYDESVTKHPVPLPSLETLVRECERGLSDEQLADYAEWLYFHVRRCNLFEIVGASRSGRKAISRLLGPVITASPETRAAALLEVL